MKTGDLISSYTVDNTTSVKYFKHNIDEPLKYCVSKDNIIFANPVKVPSLNAAPVPSLLIRKKYYSFLNLKVLDTANYSYKFRRFFA